MILKYPEIRDSLGNFDLIFSSGKSISSKVIKLWTDSRFSHVGLVYNVEQLSNNTRTKRVFVVEALSGNGVKFTTLSSYSDFVWMPTNLPFESSTEEIMWEILGSKTYYYKLGLLYSALGIKPSRDSYNFYYCSQLCVKILKTHSHLSDIPVDIGRNQIGRAHV